MITWITTCDTCKRDGWDTGDMTQTDGESLATLIEAAATGLSGVKARRVSCLMGCKKACNVAIQGHGKLNYTLGEFEPTAEAASSIVAYAMAHATSDTGRVPFREWPQAIKGHFVTRHPPLPDDE
jgi:predicted metal-binding protein